MKEVRFFNINHMHYLFECRELDGPLTLTAILYDWCKGDDVLDLNEFYCHIFNCPFLKKSDSITMYGNFSCFYFEVVKAFEISKTEFDIINIIK
jgi:hypothetical protein